MNFPIPPNEEQRLAALQNYDVLDTLPEQAYDDITRLASEICGTPIALVSLIDGERQWFKSKVGLEVAQTSRDVAFCAHALGAPHDLLLVPNALEDERFASNPLVTGAPDIRFYAGAPLATENGEVLGTLCVLDDQPRQLSEAQLQSLRSLARQVMAQLELRLRVNDLALQIQMRQQTEISLRAAIAEAEDLYDNAPCGYQSVDKNGVVQRINRTLLHWLGYSREEIVGKRTLLDIIVPEQHEKCAALFALMQKQGEISDVETIFRRRDGSRFPVLINVTAIYDEDGAFLATRASIFDNTARAATEQALRESEARFQMFMDNGPFVAFIKDEKGRYIYANEQMSKRFNLPQSELLGKAAADLMPAAIAAELRQHDEEILAANRLKTIEEMVPAPDGMPCYWLSFKFPLNSHGQQYLGCIAIDITERKIHERQLENYQRQLEEVVAKLEEMATTDALTGLKNKGAFENRLHEEWQRAKRYSLPLSLLLIDVDFFKGYNDAFGHPAGDEILKKFAEVLRQQARPSDFAARVGGEEFAIIVANTQVEGAYIVAERLRCAVEAADWPRRAVTASIGVADSADSMADFAELVEKADHALYQAKNAGRNRVVRAIE